VPAPLVPKFVRVGAGAVVAAHPLEDHARGQQQDHDAHGSLGSCLEPGRQLGLERDQGKPDQQQNRRVASSPPSAEAGRTPGVALVGRDQRCHGHEMIRIGGVTQPEHEGDAKGHN